MHPLNTLHTIRNGAGGEGARRGRRLPVDEPWHPPGFLSALRPSHSRGLSSHVRGRCERHRRFTSHRVLCVAFVHATPNFQFHFTSK